MKNLNLFQKDFNLNSEFNNEEFTKSQEREYNTDYLFDMGNSDKDEKNSFFETFYDNSEYDNQRILNQSIRGGFLKDVNNFMDVGSIDEKFKESLTTRFNTEGEYQYDKFELLKLNLEKIIHNVESVETNKLNPCDSNIASPRKVVIFSTSQNEKQSEEPNIKKNALKPECLYKKLIVGIFTSIINNLNHYERQYKSSLHEKIPLNRFYKFPSKDLKNTASKKHVTALLDMTIMEIASKFESHFNRLVEHQNNCSLFEKISNNRSKLLQNDYGSMLVGIVESTFRDYCLRYFDEQSDLFYNFKNFLSEKNLNSAYLNELKSRGENFLAHFSK